MESFPDFFKFIGYNISRNGIDVFNAPFIIIKNFDLAYISPQKL